MYLVKQANVINRKETSMKKIRMQRIANVALSLMAVMATLFANVQCRGKCYEPVVPEKLRK